MGYEDAHGEHTLSLWVKKILKNLQPSHEFIVPI